MKYCIQVLAPSFMHVNIYPLEEDNYQKAIEFVKLHGHAPFIHDLTYFDTAPADYYVVRHHQDIKIKILDENDIVLSEFKLFETTGFNLDGRTYNNKYFWEKHSKNKPCLIDRRYNNDMDLESEVMWEHEIEAENVPKKKDFEYTRNCGKEHMKMKLCKTCDVVKKLEEFYKAIEHKDGRENICKICKKRSSS